jgi:hypothetical protein
MHNLRRSVEAAVRTKDATVVFRHLGEAMKANQIWRWQDDGFIAYQCDDGQYRLKRFRIVF